MLLLSARDLCRQFDADPVFQGVTFDVRAGEKIALVGPNGCGKTTLMSVLAGTDEPDVGAVDRASNTTSSVLEQHVHFDADRSLLDEVKIGLAHLYELQDQAHKLANEMATAEGAELERLHDKYDRLHAELDRLDAYHVDHRVEEVLHGLGFTPDQYGRSLSTFSGGQQNRAMLGRLLLAAPDLLLLDEPTNHLDIAATEWLEDFLARSQQAVIVVSHDRYFLDRVTNRTLELWQGGITDYPGNFSFYWQERDERLKVLRRTREKQEEFVEKTKTFIAKNKYGQKSAQAKDRVKKLERVELVDIPPDFKEIVMGFPAPSRTGDWVIRAEGVAKGFPASGGGRSPDPSESSPATNPAPGHPGSDAGSDDNKPADLRPPLALFSDVTLQFDRGDRVGILGPNGSGKTTLLRVLLGELHPDAGHIRFGTGVELAYFDQQLASVDADLDAVEAVRQPGSRWHGDAPFGIGRGTELSPGDVRGLLARFGISGDLALQRVGSMSGGERTKVALARMHALSPNVMFLDEPTNHLDLWACAALEKSLRSFAGTVLFVSHDRYFIDKVATKVLVFEEDRWRIHEGNYSDYQHFVRAVAEGQSVKQTERKRSKTEKSVPAGPEKAPAKRDSKPAKRTRRFAYRRLDEIEADIAHEETLIARLEVDLADPGVHRDADRMTQVQTDYNEAQQRLAELLEHWEEAAELN